MGEHYTKNTQECNVWCNKCQKSTPHRVDSGRRGPCLECIARMDDVIKNTGGWSKAQLKKREKAAKERQNPRLF